MGERTSHEPGTFSWAELATNDPDAAKGFYTSLFGWAIEDMPAGEGQVYSMARLNDKYVAGMSTEGAGDGIPPHWNNYVTVESADDAAYARGNSARPSCWSRSTCWRPGGWR